MRDKLAEELLARVMAWTAPEVAQYRPILQAMAAYKYDGYQRFSPGMRFIENLALWLQQFRTMGERRVAFQFVAERLIYVSSEEINHLVAIAYPDFIRPKLLARAAEDAGHKPWHVGRVASSPIFKLHERRCLFLGLSDGARTDVFRRTNALSNEQIRQTHELTDDRIDELLRDLRRSLKENLDRDPTEAESKFNTVVLLDDFSGSGLSYLRREGDERKGKIKRFHETATRPDGAFRKLVCSHNTQLIVVLYLATEAAKTYLETQLKDLFEDSEYQTSLIVVQVLPSNICIRAGQNELLDAILTEYYDTTNETPSTALGGTDLRYGFAGAGLPLVLVHNTPNNSIGLLWAEGLRMRPLFPRVTRH